MKNAKIITQPNDVILESVTKAVSFMILAFAIYIFWTGHNSPGGGFVGGLITASAFLLKYLALDMETMKNRTRVSYNIMIGVGLLIAVSTGLGGVIFGHSFLTHAFGHPHLPVIGDVALATASLFDLGVFLVVVGVTMTIILSIGADD